MVRKLHQCQSNRLFILRQCPDLACLSRSLSLPCLQLNFACFLDVQTVSKRLANAKSDKFHGNIHKRGQVALEEVSKVSPMSKSSHHCMLVFASQLLHCRNSFTCLNENHVRSPGSYVCWIQHLDRVRQGHLASSSITDPEAAHFCFDRPASQLLTCVLSDLCVRATECEL